MPAAFLTLKLAYDDLEVDLLNLAPDARGAHLADSGMAPATHRRRKGRVGGLGVFAENTTKLKLNIDGATATDCLSVLNDIARILDAADAGAPPGVLPARLICQPVGSEQTPLIAYLKPSLTDADLLTLPVTFNELLHVYEINDITLTLPHFPWVGADEASDVSGFETIPNTQPVNFPTNHPYPSPVSLTIETTLTLASDSARFPPSILMVARSSNHLAVVEAEDGAGANGFTSVATTGGNPASNYTVLRYTPGGSTAWKQCAPLFPPFWWEETPNRRVACYAAVKATGGDFEAEWVAGTYLPPGATSWQYGVYDGNTQSGGLRLIDAGRHANPTLIHLGTVLVPDEIGLQVMALRARAIAGTGTLEIDYLAIIGLDDVTSRVIVIDGASRGEIGIQQPRIRTSRWWETERAQVVAYLDRANAPDINAPLGHDGRSDLVSSGDRLAALWLATGSENPAYWRATHNGEVLGWSFQAVRAPVFPVVQ